MKVYRVGGSVRDELLGRAIADRDFVVVGATPEEMLARGFRPVGRDFPVFLHPDTGEEYALARTERKRGRGHRGFAFHAAPDVTLEQDLARRDLTINAMARAEDGTLIDPYGGAADLRAGVLRHVGPGFLEDPLRVLRVARFAARFGFSVAPATEALLRAIAESGELATLTAERVWQELARALMEAHPSRFFALLERCGALEPLLPELAGLFAAGPRGAPAGDSDPAARRLRALDLAAAAAEPLPVRYAVLACDLAPPKPGRGREAKNARLAAALSRRVKAPAECRDLAQLVARRRGALDRIAELSPSATLDLLLAADALRRPERFEQFLRACALDWAARSGAPVSAYPPAQRLRAARDVVRSVPVGAIARARSSRTPLAQRIRGARLRALRDWSAALRSE
jgi:tRNA nucleotidyltransferase (CCA-adding enzyme)